MSFLNQFIDNKKKTRNKVPKKGTISYCKYMIARVESSQKTRLEKREIIKRWERRIESLRDAKVERKADRLSDTAKKYSIDIEEQAMIIARLKDEIKELKLLLKIPVNDGDNHAALIESIKTLKCNLTGVKGIYPQRDQLPYPFNQWSRRKLEMLVMQLIKFKKLSRLPGGLII